MSNPLCYFPGLKALLVYYEVPASTLRLRSRHQIVVPQRKSARLPQTDSQGHGNEGPVLQEKRSLSDSAQ